MFGWGSGKASRGGREHQAEGSGVERRRSRRLREARQLRAMGSHGTPSSDSSPGGCRLLKAGVKEPNRQFEGTPRQRHGGGTEVWREPGNWRRWSLEVMAALQRRADGGRSRGRGGGEGQRKVSPGGKGSTWGASPAFSSGLTQRLPPKQQARRPGGEDQECSRQS